jgi:hypothetical protein
MHTVTVTDQSSARRLAPLQPVRESRDTHTEAVLEDEGCAKMEGPADVTVLLMALEELELRRAALEVLVDEGLLWRCLV